MVGRQRHVYHVEPGQFPEDFPGRLDRLRQAAGLSWREMARRLKINDRTVRRWRLGAQPNSAHLYSLLNFAAGEGLLHVLLPAVGIPQRTEARIIRCA